MYRQLFSASITTITILASTAPVLANPLNKFESSPPYFYPAELVWSSTSPHSHRRFASVRFNINEKMRSMLLKPQIEFLVQQRKCGCQSLDTTVIGTDLSLINTIPSQEDLFDSITHADLILKVREAVTNLDRRYGDRGYLKLWQGKVAGKHYTKVMEDLGVSQSELSRRWKELVARVVVELGLQQVEAIKGH